MEVKLTIVVLVTMTLLLDNLVSADFFFNHPLPKPDSLAKSKYKCVPGRTIVKITEKLNEILDGGISDSDEFRLRNGRRKHSTIPTKDESCQMCVCSADGQHEYCRNRAANTVNECLVLKDLKDKFQAALPFEHTKNLSFRMRRDYIWHNDEIPYNSKAKCYRGHSYYSNSITANDTDIDIGSEIDSLLNYDNENTCFFCICSVDGNGVGCIHRAVSFCNFFRVIRNEKAIRDRYTSLLQQDRPTYFRQLSWRMRRTMDEGIYGLLESVAGDTLPENTKCVPFVSEYSNCNEDNICSGCTKCVCTSEGQWSCKDVKECGPGAEDPVEAEEDIFDNALRMLEYELEKKKYNSAQRSKHHNVPRPDETAIENGLIDRNIKDYKMDEIMSILLRTKRSTTNTTKNNKHSKRSIEKTSHKYSKNSNHTVKFYDTIDELNEDTLKDSNISGTLPAKKMDMIPQLAIMRRSGEGENSTKSLQIEYNQPKTYRQISDNKIDAMEQENKFDASHEHLKIVLGNQTQKVKDKDLSKIVVNELKKGSEVIGDTNAPVTSNITFTPENDTLTAMAFIAGNLLNKLWNMEKDASGSSMEADVMKHEKITELLDLFKEPLNLRQETFLKNALEQLSNAIDNDKEVTNISVCENIEKAKKILDATNITRSDEEMPQANTKAPYKKYNIKLEEDRKKLATAKAISKINNVLDLIRRFEGIQGTLSELKHGPKLDFNIDHKILRSKKPLVNTLLTKDEHSSLNVFGNILEKITKFLMPKRNNKKLVNQIQSQNILGDNDDLKKKFMKMYNIDLTNMTVTAKDKLILDYLTHIDGNPDCLLNNSNKKKSKSLPSIEGNILLNLSEFFKMKSFTDLIKLLESEKQEYQLLRVSTTATVNEVSEVTEHNFNFVQTTTEGEKQMTTKTKDSRIVDSQKLNSTKEKLKSHLKTIIEDLIELQNVKGVSMKGNIKIADALPCIYNILNAGKEETVTKKVETNNPIQEIANIFNGLKKEIKLSQSRRKNNNIPEERPKSAAVWERVIKNLNEKSNTRRLLTSKTPKSYDTIKGMMDRIENASSTFKQYALLVEVPPAGKLMLLKTLEQEVTHSIDVLEEIKLALSKLPSSKFSELEEFISNIATRMSLNDKVNEKIKQEQRKYFVDEINSNNKMLKTKLKKKPALRYGEIQDSDDLRVSRDQIINQLIKNRMQLYISTKEDKEFDVNNDMNFNIAKRVLYYLDAGNYNLAREMFKVFVTQTQDKAGNPASYDRTNDKFVATTTAKYMEAPMRRMASHQKEPLLQFDDSKAKQIKWMNQDHLIKQLLNIKNMGM